MANRRQSTPKTTRTKTIKTPRLAKAITLRPGDHVQLNAREKTRTLTAALPVPDRPDSLVLKFETGAERIVRTSDDVIVVDIEKVEVPV